MTDESLDGELLIEFLANSMRESFRTRLHSMKATLGVPNGVKAHDLKKNLEAETKVKNRIRKKVLEDTNVRLDELEVVDIIIYKERVDAHSMRRKTSTSNCHKNG